jgi:hypothetical protein
MKQVLSAKLKLHTTPEQFQALRTTQLAYRDALNDVSQYSFDHGKKSSGQALQRDCYTEEGQKGEPEAAKGQCGPLQVELCPTAWHDRL